MPDLDGLAVQKMFCLTDCRSVGFTFNDRCGLRDVLVGANRMNSKNWHGHTPVL
ncbi:MAG: hypothetical protein ACXWKA_13575 [Xanthobacteraceae bacterium]